MPSPPEPSAPAPGPITTGESEVVPAPEVEPVTKRGAAIAALILSIFPVINLIALGLAIYAVVRSDRPGRSGERGLAIAAVVISGLLLIPVNVGGFVAATSPLLFKSAMMRPDVKTTAATPSPAAVKH